MYNKVFLLMIVLNTIFITSLYSFDYRPVEQRIHHIAYNSVNWSGNTSSYSIFYYYSDNNTALIDSIITPQTNYKFTHSVTPVENNLRQINYQEFHNFDPVIYRNYIYTIDQENKIHQVETSGGNYLIQEFYHYNQFNKPDSIVRYSTNVSFNITTGTKFILSYDAQHRLIQGIYCRSINQNSPWENEERFLQTYSANVTPLISPLKIINFRLQSLLYNLNYLTLILDEQYKAETITYQTSIDGLWVNSDVDYYSSMSNDALSLRREYYYDSSDWGYDQWLFSGSGLYNGKYHACTDIYSETSSELIYYENYTANIDDYQNPALVELINTYPNPFQQDLSIKINYKESVPSEINIYNIKGQLVRAWKDVKSDELIWDGKDNDNNPVKSGVYIIRVKNRGQIYVSRVIKL